jgi:glycosyltransferase involved in cell wall biosynthesis
VTLRVAILTWRDSGHPDGGGSEVFVEQVARELVRRGHDVELFTSRYDGSSAEDDLDGVRIQRRGGRLTVYLHGLVWVARRRQQHDVVLDVINGLPFGAPLVRRRGVVALVHHSHQRQWQIIYPGWPGRLGWFVEHSVTPRLYRSRPYVTVSSASHTDLVGQGVPADRIVIARNGVDTRPVDAAVSPTPRLIVLARLVPHKQIEDAFEIVRRLRATVPGLGLDVVGDGWWRDELEEAASDLTAVGAVRFHGRVEEGERDRLLAAAWAMVLPSVKEGWGLAAMEAAVQATPTLAYRYAGGVAEAVVDEETGLLADDLDGLVAQTRRVLTEEELRNRLSTAAAERAAGFTWSETADVVEQALLAEARRAQLP